MIESIDETDNNFSVAKEKMISDQSIIGDDSVKRNSITSCSATDLDLEWILYTFKAQAVEAFENNLENYIRNINNVSDTQHNLNNKEEEKHNKYISTTENNNELLEGLAKYDHDDDIPRKNENTAVLQEGMKTLGDSLTYIKVNSACNQLTFAQFLKVCGKTVLLLLHGVDEF